MAGAKPLTDRQLTVAGLLNFDQFAEQFLYTLSHNTDSIAILVRVDWRQPSDEARFVYRGNALVEFQVPVAEAAIR
jgi:hypothetical protein